MPTKRKRKKKSGQGLIAALLKTLDVAAQNAPKVERIYHAYSNIKRLADKDSEHRSVSSPKIRKVRQGFGIIAVIAFTTTTVQRLPSERVNDRLGIGLPSQRD